MDAVIALLAGDGIGPDVSVCARKVLSIVADKYEHNFTFREELIGGVAIEASGDPLPAATVDCCKSSDAVLLGAVGGPSARHNGYISPEIEA